MGQRMLACTTCHGKEGRAGPDGFYPRLAGKPAGYLFNQLVHFRDGRRHYGPMARLLEPLGDDYLQEIARHFAAQDLPYPPAPVLQGVSGALRQRGEQLALRGDSVRQIPACVACHGAGLTGVQPRTPGLLGLPRDYLNAQLGAWRSGQRRAHAPDCMAQIAQRMDLTDVNAVATWLALQPVPRNSKPVVALTQAPPMTCGTHSAEPPPVRTVAQPVAATPAPTAVVRGSYLARAGNCMTCHTARGGEPYAGGRSIETPFGTVFAGNLTPDAATGLGRWTADDFWRALNEGRSRDGRLLVPAFPYTSYTQVSRSDSDALYAYLMSLKPVVQANAPHALRWPYNTQAALWAWRALYFKPETFVPDPARDVAWNRGAYLVRGLGHCAGCHTARNALGASDSGNDLAGGLIPQQNWYAPSLTAAAEAGVADWPLTDIVALLRSGQTPRAAVLGPMAEVVQHSTQHLSDADLAAMATYLKALPGETTRARPPVTAALPVQVQHRGARIYEQQCAQCHGPQGEGVAGAYPRLAGNRAVTLPVTSNLVQIVLNGGFAPATAGNPRPYGMPPFVLQLTDSDTAAVLSYIRNAWGNSASMVTEIEVTRQRDSLR